MADPSNSAKTIPFYRPILDWKQLEFRPQEQIMEVFLTGDFVIAPFNLARLETTDRYYEGNGYFDFAYQWGRNRLGVSGGAGTDYPYTLDQYPAIEDPTMRGKIDPFSYSTYMPTGFANIVYTRLLDRPVRGINNYGQITLQRILNNLTIMVLQKYQKNTEDIEQLLKEAPALKTSDMKPEEKTARFHEIVKKFNKLTDAQAEIINILFYCISQGPQTGTFKVTIDTSFTINNPLFTITVKSLPPSLSELCKQLSINPDLAGGKVDKKTLAADIATLAGIEVSEDIDKTMDLVQARLDDFYTEYPSEKIRDNVVKRYGCGLEEQCGIGTSPKIKLLFDAESNTDLNPKEYVYLSEALKYLATKDRGNEADKVSIYLKTSATPSMLPMSRLNPFPTNDDTALGGLLLTDPPAAWLGDRLLLNAEIANAGEMNTDFGYSPGMSSNTNTYYILTGAASEYKFDSCNKLTPSISLRYLISEGDVGNGAPLWTSAGLKYDFMVPALKMPHTFTIEGMASTSLFDGDGFGNELRTALQASGWFRPCEDWIFTASVATMGVMPWGDSYSYIEKDYQSVPEKDKLHVDVIERWPFDRPGGWGISGRGSAQYRLTSGDLGWLDLAGVAGADYLSENGGLGIFAGVGLAGSLDFFSTPGRVSSY